MIALTYEMPSGGLACHPTGISHTPLLLFYVGNSLIVTRGQIKGVSSGAHHGLSVRFGVGPNF